MKHVLDLPFAADELKEKYSLKTIKGGYSLYAGVLLPKELRPYKSLDFSYTRWLEDEANAHVSTPEKEGRPRVLTPEQEVAIAQIVEAYQLEASGFILNQKQGFQKELIALASTAAMAKTLGVKSWDEGANKAKLLIVTSKSMIPHWRKHLKSLPVVTAMARPLIITPNQLSKLLMAPPAARLTAKKSSKERSTARNGVPTVDWNFIIFDDPFTLGVYPNSALAASAAAVAKLQKEYVKGHSPFVISLTQKMSFNPLDYSLMARIISTGVDKTSSVGPNEWGKFLLKNKYAVKETPKGFVWMGDPPKRGPESKILTQEQVIAIAARDAKNFSNALAASAYIKLPDEKTDKYFIQALPIELRGSHKLAYENIWKDLKNWLNRHLMNTDPEGYAKQVARYHWRVNELKKEYIFDLVVDLLEKEQDVVVKTPTIETIGYYAEKLAKKRIPFGTVTSLNEKEHFAEIERFNQDRCRVLLTTDTINENRPPITKKAALILTDALELASFSREALDFWETKPEVIYTPYLESTLEERIHSEVLSEEATFNSYNVNPVTIEKIYRRSAAVTTPPNRMS